MDNGFPLSTENNVLKELVHPPSGIKSAMKAIGVGNKSKYEPNTYQFCVLAPFPLPFIYSF